ncbi:hypothetical protein Ddye_013724 [Dipteronia dyeriana]|uniref:Reverse transcriptase zinc-binding domain-containing protein n=1 Tax=Dipteronia dyeriana TaxID=168575 RepID=A0AAD9X6Y4_9ROSI|nr:hypothetical protein Ddye_013724 [Dipteronia dyeriana]
MALMCIPICRCIADALAWTFCPNRGFSVSSLRRCLEERGSVDNSGNTPLLWLGFVPPKIEIFLWQLLKGGILVREVLFKIGWANLASIDCPLCTSKTESLNHLFFFHCDWSWKLWSEAMGWWDVRFYCNMNLHEWTEGWLGLCASKDNKRDWIVLFYAVRWTIWEFRNAMVFNGFSLSVRS